MVFVTFRSVTFTGFKWLLSRFTLHFVPEERHVSVVLVKYPLGQKSPEDPERNPDDDLNGSVEDELPERGAFAERDPEEDPEAADGDDVVRGAGGDDESGDPLGHAVPAAGEGHEGGDDDGGGDGSQDEAQHEAHCNTGKCYFLHVLQVNETGFDICNESKCSSPVQGKPSRRMERTATATAGGALQAASPC